MNQCVFVFYRSQDLRGYHQLTLPYFCAIKDVNLVIHLELERELWRSEKSKQLSLFHKRHLKANGGCGVFRTSPTSSHQPFATVGSDNRPHQPWGLWQYLKLCYSREVKFKTQPVLEAFPDKSTETWRYKKIVEDSVGISKIYWSNLRIIFFK